MYQKVRYKAIPCEFCGKSFEPNRKDKRYCSKSCRDGHKSGPFHKVCAYCGKPFDTWSDRIKTCSEDCSNKYHNETRRKYDNLQVKCAICGKVVFTKQPSQRTCLSDECRKEYSKIQHRARNLRNKERSKELQKAKKEEYKALHTVKRECAECGALFYCLDTETRVTCSSMCSKKYANRKSARRVPKRQRVDTISLKRLFKRDGGICYICGERCDFDDWRKSRKGNIYPGDNYPTIEHVIPISKGGLDAWDNVRLAHWKCNIDKSDGIIKMQPMSKQFAYSEKHSATQAKKTAQYTLDGKLIKIWDSTAQIGKELNINVKHIQNVCRGDKSNTGNAYGFHWEYVV